eukprot:Partr_v1_DN24233_c0_g1_i2_m36883 putative presenilin associated, rhomboid-like
MQFLKPYSSIILSRFRPASLAITSRVMSTWRPGARGRSVGFPRQLSGIKPQSLVNSLIAINTIVFLEWQRAKHLAGSRGDFSALDRMNRHFTCSAQGVLKEGRIHTLITSIFSHQNPIHFAFNMFALYSFGTTMISLLGAREVMKLFIGGGVASTACSVAYHSLDDGGRGVRSMGASGGVMSLLAAFGILMPEYQVILLVFPVPAKYA